MGHRLCRRTLTPTAAKPSIVKEYRVLEINQGTRTLKAVRSDNWGVVCHRELYNATLGNPSFEYSPDTQPLTLFYVCGSNLWPNISNRFNCSVSGSNTINFYSVADMSSEGNFPPSISNPALQEALATCRGIVVLNISQTEAATLESNTVASNDILTNAVDTGFGLIWKANDALCLYCQRNGSHCGHDLSSDELVCYANTVLPFLAVAESLSKRNLVIGISAAAVGLLILFAIILCIYKREAMIFWKKENTEDFDVEAFMRNYTSFAPKQYCSSQLKKMTNSFAEVIGKGGYGCVYKGTLSDGRLVAVKLLKDSKSNGEDFINEVVSMGRTSHVNIVTLLGFCCERNKKALIYDFMHNGSLGKFIFNKEYENASRCLEWKTLYDIAIGIARGLEYLHRGCSTRILHFDKKPQNILLDKDFCPTIFDFGLAKLWLNKESIVSMMGARGTAGYIAQEVFSRNFGGVSHKSDVYSYGMLVLEMVGGRRNIDPRVSHTSEIYFLYLIYEDVELGNDLRLLGVTTEEEKEIAMKMVVVGFWCIQTNPSDQTQMSKVVDMLEGDLQSIQIPPKPFLFSPARSPRQSTKSS
ncbi:LEAF RUST 10 DISEASE-RESISTANCE LOCUS RECEPTOR-LIKE PROTEIN KINASE-like 2.5 [Ziziphus jujuba]|uniref:LEAF RUST 10 DISEASE-RESISTANCE LOCUS RECEPTOR-LIKE PROTEIN KINASE-like 2.5 n=1 Tax=Ziziphus jujuba TaxID=326968 RepID=A0ABM3IHF7_ZIZJJ|nr:LEAF RUST 10 DISEASE-RESISTANCE LOCUS RECEPTOR-LIKE PROTEIN KINASE-like 2.5 [Ziziphus jujuba]